MVGLNNMPTTESFIELSLNDRINLLREEQFYDRRNTAHNSLAARKPHDVFGSLMSSEPALWKFAEWLGQQQASEDPTVKIITRGVHFGAINEILGFRHVTEQNPRNVVLSNERACQLVFAKFPQAEEVVEGFDSYTLQLQNRAPGQPNPPSPDLAIVFPDGKFRFGEATTQDGVNYFVEKTRQYMELLRVVKDDNDVEFLSALRLPLCVFYVTADLFDKRAQKLSRIIQGLKKDRQIGKKTISLIGFKPLPYTKRKLNEFVDTFLTPDEDQNPMEVIAQSTSKEPLDLGYGHSGFYKPA